MKIYFLAARCIPVESTSLEKRPLGGTETALIRVSECLSALGHQVTVFSSHANPETGTNPLFLNARRILEDPTCDIAIAVQDWWPLIGYPLKAKRYLFWTGDAGDQFLTFGIGDKRVAGRIDCLLTVSQWHKQHLCKISGFPLEKAAAIYNGVHLPWYQEELERKPKRIIFTTSPYRGLPLTVPIIQQLAEKHPDLEYHVYSGLAVYDREKPFEGPQVEQLNKILDELRKIPQCKIFGNVTQQQLALALQQATIFLYPSIFPESSSIATLEAQAAGCVPVVGDFAALAETVGETGIVVSGHTPGSKEYIQAFVTQIEKLFETPALLSDLSVKCKNKIAAEFSWNNVTSRFLDVCALDRKTN